MIIVSIVLNPPPVCICVALILCSLLIFAFL